MQKGRGNCQIELCNVDPPLSQTRFGACGVVSKKGMSVQREISEFLLAGAAHALSTLLLLLASLSSLYCLHNWKKKRI